MPWPALPDLDFDQSVAVDPVQFVAKVSHRDLDDVDAGSHPQRAFVGVKAYRNVAQSVADSTVTTVAFDTELFDSDAIHSAGTFTIPTAGKWLLTATVHFDVNTTGYRQGWWELGGVRLAQDGIGNLSSLVQGVVKASTIESLAAADALVFRVYQTSGGALNARAGRHETFAAVTYLGP
jgi:hypothetical protein